MEQKNRDILGTAQARLCETGYDAHRVTINKNGVTMQGIAVKLSDGVSRVYYAGHCEDAEHLIQHITESMTEPYPESLVNDLLDPDFVHDNMIIGLKRETPTEVVSRPCRLLDGITEHLCVIAGDDESAISFDVTHAFLLAQGIEEDRAWEIALANTIRSTRLYDMEGLLLSMGARIESGSADERMCVLTSALRHKGAGCVLNADALQAAAKRLKCRYLTLLPSSIHEVILVKAESDNAEDFSDMVRSINGTCVDPCEQLADRAYSLGPFEV